MRENRSSNGLILCIDQIEVIYRLYKERCLPRLEWQTNVLGGDFLAVPDDEIASIPVDMTMVGGHGRA